MASVIAKNFYVRCTVGIITNVNDIPKPWRKEATGYLEEDGYIINEDGTFYKETNN